jgi:hypothetical protein
MTVPDRFIVIWNGSVVIDTGYRGGSFYDFGQSGRNSFNASLLGKVDPVLGTTYPDTTNYPDDGYPRIVGVGAGTAVFNKSSASPATCRVEVYAPLPGTAWNYTLGCPVSSKLILDDLNSAAAYSLRKLRTAYLGAAINVRRSSDGATQDIGFVNNNLDTASLLAFVGTGNGFVRTWYDQSGNGRNATQTTLVNQPQIVDSGAVITMSCRPALRFDGNDILNTPSFMLGNTVVTVARRSSNFQPVVEGANVASTDRGLWGLRSGTTDFTTHLNYGINGGPLNATNADGFPMNVIQIVSQTVAKGTVATNSSIWRIGGGGGGYVPLNGFISEMVAISSLLSTTDRQTIESNQMQYYCITSSTSYQAKYGSNLSTICSQSAQTVYGSGVFATGTTVYSDAALTIPLTGNIYISETVSGTIWNINSSTGVIGTSTGNIC